MQLQIHFKKRLCFRLVFFYNYGCDLDLAAWVLLLHCFYSKVVLYVRLCPNLTKGKENQA